MNRYNVTIGNINFLGIFAETAYEAAKNAVSRMQLNKDEKIVDNDVLIKVENVYIKDFSEFRMNV